MFATRHIIFFVLALLAVLVLFFANLMFGTVDIPFEQVVQSFFGQPAEKQSWEFILQDFRLPKALTAVLAGSGLALSGLLMQTLFRNPLAGPFVLGISNGASLGVAILVLSGSVVLGKIIPFGSWGLVVASVAGSGLVLSLVLLVSLKVNDNLSLLIVGFMFGSISGAIVSVLQYFSSPELIQAFIIWTFGSLGGVTWVQLGVMCPLVLLGILLAFFAQKSMNAMLLGDEYAKSLGVATKKIRLLIILSTCLLAGAVTAFCGPIAFVGLAIPHVARSILNTSNHSLLIPAVVVLGAVLLLGCDLLAQLPGSQKVLPINAVTAIIGAPIVIWIILKTRNLKTSF